MTAQPDLADFVRRRISIGRVQPGMNYVFFSYWALPYYGPPLPAVPQIANDLVADAEFKGLRLGGFFSTPTGEFLEQAVEMVVPKALSPEFELIVAGLKLAADRQRGEKWGKALATVGGGIVVGAVLRELGTAA